ncbi:hypothetical protein C8A00DRAFT_42397 [Chaetomidium leptoderma]|uniref:DUF4604 domain-containing protein n=1 Tax=Chaetomidium leptoderma TaxID=669021 RepID=A0AAN6VR77_9PEZI|nr:hypothetical protein C8A00DRAFT_42397 [Chaetomidium leptoderma]
MSQKITSKNLQYNTNLPPFLARLRGENASGADRGAPDPILAARRRPGKPRSGSAEAEDAPLVVDEHGNAVDVTVGTDGTVKEKESASTETEEKGAPQDPPADTTDAVAAASAGEKVAGIGDQRKKRKIGRVIGADADEEDALAKSSNNNSNNKKQGRAKTQGNTTTTALDDATKEKNDAAATTATTKAKTKKKAKKIKLSFGDDEG